MSQCDNEPYINTLLQQVFAGQGIVFIAERELEPVGMLVAIKNTNIWDPSLVVMNELCYWVDPEHRGGTSGYRLLAAYKEHCEMLKSHKAIEAYTISKMSNSPDLDYGRFGFEKLEEYWRA
jgi:GNAT superfamily N-acetyltransferase